MFRCKMGYSINEDGTPPDRCNSDGKFYRLKQSSINATYAHQQKAENQQELMRVTIDALKYYRDNY